VASDKGEKPTARRLRRAREQGDGPRSAALAQAVGFVVALALTPAAVSTLAVEAGGLLRAAIERPDQPLGPSELVLAVVSLTVPIVLATAAACAASHLVQTGGALAGARIVPSLDRLNPLSGLRQLTNAERAFGVLRALTAALFVGYFTCRTLVSFAPDIAFGIGEPASAGALAAALGQRVAWGAALFGLGLGALDLAVVHRGFLRRHRMTREEVERERRESEGDPRLKAARRRAHREVLSGSTVNAVERATVLIVRGAALAVALSYDEERDRAPRILALGEGDLAARMIEAARARGVPCVRDAAVAGALGELAPGDEIPEALYEAVAEILREAWVSDPAA
jgi:flagellar biosynthesis protein FlhB